MRFCKEREQCKMAAKTTRTMDSGGADGAPATGPKGPWQARYLQVLLLFVGFTLAYAMRICMSVAIVAMTTPATSESDYKSYSWDSIEKGYILSSFFWGYTITQIPAGALARSWSAHRLLSIGVFLCAIFSLLTECAADLGGWGLVCACRVGMGLCQGCVLPSIHTLLSKWVPPAERARLGSIAYAGSQSGAVIADMISGPLAASAAGWPSVFYFFAGVSILWTIVFYFFGADSPSTSTRISEEEKHYIESSLNSGQDEKADLKKSKTPWKEIFTSVPVWALVVAHCGQNWGFWMIITEISIYMKNVLNFELAENGFKASLPYLAMLLLVFPVSWLSDFALKKGVRVIVLRKIANTLSQFGPALALVGLCFSPPGDTNLPVVILIIAVGTNVGSLCGFQINHIDLSPNYAGILMSITNCAASIIAIVTPIAAGAIVTDPTDVSQWHTVFYLTAGVYFAANTVFLVFASADRQWWDDPKAVENRRNLRFDGQLVPVVAVEPSYTVKQNS